MHATPIHPRDFGLTRIRYTRRAAFMLRQLRQQCEDVFHALRGLILQLSVNSSIDNRQKFLKDFGSGRATPVYMDDEWWIVYRVNLDDGEEVFSVISIWDARNPPGALL